jgi:membrane dipeptidase
MIDGHNDLAWAMLELADHDLDAIDLLAGEPRLQTDLPRLRAGGVSGQFWSVFVPCELSGADAVRATLEQVDFVHRLIARYPDQLAAAGTADEVEAARGSGRIASLMGMEGGHSIAGSLGVLRTMFTLGVRYLTLTHNQNVPWADSATDTPVLHGLSDFGEEVVREMNALGMLVDLSHVSADVMRHALRVSAAPPIFSHSSARAVCDHPRNVPDDVLTTLAARGGVCMVTFVPEFVSPARRDWGEQALEGPRSRGEDLRSWEAMSAAFSAYASTVPAPPATVADVVAHVEHVREVAGIDHVGIGGDLDGTESLPVGLEDASCYPNLFAALADRGWSRVELDKLSSGNVLRVMRAAEDVAAGS